MMDSPLLEGEECVIIQRIVDAGAPSDANFRRWVHACMKDPLSREVTLRLVDEAEMAQLNHTYRHKSGPTNVLSFPYEDIPGVDDAVMGDIILCVSVIAREAAEQGVALALHWAHMTVHGMLHLQGYDHQTEPEAAQMQELEATILVGLGFDNPYQ
jgi:probable rRNA maturation factor